MNNVGVTGFQNTTFGINNLQVDEASGKIISYDVYGNTTCVGYTVKAYNEVKQMLEEAVKKSEEHQRKEEEYHKMLVDNGVLKRELTTDEKINALTNTVTQLVTSVNQITIDVNAIKGVVDELSGPPSSGKNAVSK